MRKQNRSQHDFQLNWGIKRLFNRLWVNFDSLFLEPLYERLKYYFIQRIIWHYGAVYGNPGDEKSQNINKKTGNLGYGLLHYSLIRNIRPQRILCIGSMYGYVPFMCALACKDNRKGEVDFVDASYDVHNPADKNRHHFGQGFWKKNDPKKHFSYFGASDKITTYIMTSVEFARKYPQRRYEYIYIDGDHSYRGACLDYKLFWPRLEKRGMMVFHDADRQETIKGVEFGVKKLWQEIKIKNKSWIELPNQASGLGILQKK